MFNCTALLFRSTNAGGTVSRCGSIKGECPMAVRQGVKMFRRVDVVYVLCSATRTALTVAT